MSDIFFLCSHVGFTRWKSVFTFRHEKCPFQGAYCAVPQCLFSDFFHNYEYWQNNAHIYYSVQVIPDMYLPAALNQFWIEVQIGIVAIVIIWFCLLLFFVAPSVVLQIIYAVSAEIALYRSRNQYQPSFVCGIVLQVKFCAKGCIFHQSHRHTSFGLRFGNIVCYKDVGVWIIRRPEHGVR